MGAAFAYRPKHRVDNFKSCLELFWRDRMDFLIRLVTAFNRDGSQQVLHVRILDKKYGDRRDRGLFLGKDKLLYKKRNEKLENRYNDCISFEPNYVDE